MSERLTHSGVQAALEDLKHRTLAAIAIDFARLIYLASTRDYNTGRYYHDGLAFQFSEAIAGRALAEAHREIFFNVALSPLQDLTQQIQLYLESMGVEPNEVIRSWGKLEPYRVIIPLGVDSLTADLFLSNVRIALPIVEARLQRAR